MLLDAIATARVAQAHFPEASAMLAMGFVQLQRGDYESTMTWTSQALEAFRRLESTADDARYFSSLALSHLGQICLISGDIADGGVVPPAGHRRSSASLASAGDLAIRSASWGTSPAAGVITTRHVCSIERAWSWPAVLVTHA